MKRTVLVIFITAGGTEAAFAAEGNEFKIAAVRTAIHGTTPRRVAAVDHLVYVFHNGGPGMEFIDKLFIIIVENGL